MIRLCNVLISTDRERILPVENGLLVTNGGVPCRLSEVSSLAWHFIELKSPFPPLSVAVDISPSFESVEAWEQGIDFYYPNTIITEFTIDTPDSDRI